MGIDWNKPYWQVIYEQPELLVNTCDYVARVYQARLTEDITNSAKKPQKPQYIDPDEYIHEHYMDLVRAEMPNLDPCPEDNEFLRIGREKAEGRARVRHYTRVHKAKRAAQFANAWYIWDTKPWTEEGPYPNKDKGCGDYLDWGSPKWRHLERASKRERTVRALKRRMTIDEQCEHMFKRLKVYERQVERELEDLWKMAIEYEEDILWKKLEQKERNVYYAKLFLAEIERNIEVALFGEWKMERVLRELLVESLVTKAERAIYSMALNEKVRHMEKEAECYEDLMFHIRYIHGSLPWIIDLEQAMRFR